MSKITVNYMSFNIYSISFWTYSHPFASNMWVGGWLGVCAWLYFSELHDLFIQYILLLVYLSNIFMFICIYVYFIFHILFLTIFPLPSVHIVSFVAFVADMAQIYIFAEALLVYACWPWLRLCFCIYSNQYIFAHFNWFSCYISILPDHYHEAWPMRYVYFLFYFLFIFIRTLIVWFSIF